VKEWSGRWDSNPRLDLGKVPYYPYTTAAQNTKTLACQPCIDKFLPAHGKRRTTRIQIAHKWDKLILMP
jgi:hypothetical protein